MSYTVTTLGQSLPVVGSGQAFEPTVQNANSLLLESTLLTTRTSVQVLQGQLRSPADLNALAALVGMTQGQLALVQEGGALFEYSGTAWVQQTPAAFATTGARDTAYAKASGAYKTQGAQVQIATLPYPMYYSVADTKWKGGQLGGGPYLLKPTITAVAGTSAVMGADGRFVYTAVTQLRIDGLPDDFEHYMFKLFPAGAANNGALTVQLTKAGAANTGANYSQGGRTTPTSGAAADLQTLGVTQWSVGLTTTFLGQGVVELDLFSPKIATRYTGLRFGSYGFNATAPTTYEGRAGHGVLDAYDGILITAASAITGYGEVWGWNLG